VYLFIKIYSHTSGKNNPLMEHWTPEVPECKFFDQYDFQKVHKESWFAIKYIYNFFFIKMNRYICSVDLIEEYRDSSVDISQLK